MPGNLLILEGPPDEHDTILLGTVAAWAGEGPVSFLRANKPNWCLEVTRYAGDPIDPEEADAVADSRLVLELIAEEHLGRPIAPRREIVLVAMGLVARRLGLSLEESATWHRDGYEWAVRSGRWDDAGIAALEARFEALCEGIEVRLGRPADPRLELRWSLVSRPSGSAARAITAAQALLSAHANRLGVFAEAEAILHFLMFRRAGGAHAGNPS